VTRNVQHSAWQEVPDHPLERQKEPALADREKPRQQLGNFHAREALLGGFLVADEDSEAE